MRHRSRQEKLATRILTSRVFPCSPSYVATSFALGVTNLVALANITISLPVSFSGAAHPVTRACARTPGHVLPQQKRLLSTPAHVHTLSTTHVLFADGAKGWRTAAKRRRLILCKQGHLSRIVGQGVSVGVSA